MKNLAIVVLVSLVAGCSKGPGNNVTPPPLPPSKEWKLVWSDEFDYTGAPASSKWGFEEGFIRNFEKQYYTNRIENAFVKDGLLTIKAIKESWPNKDYKSTANIEDWKKTDEFARYTSASLQTYGKAEWKYGKMEMRAKLPRGAGVWPAFWTLGSDIYKVGWPESGEIDIMEHVGKQPSDIFSNIHFPNPSTQAHTNREGKTTIVNPWEDFHIYSLEWDADKMVFKLDGKVYHTFNTKDAGTTFAKPHFIKLNFAVGGSWGGTVDDSIFPQSYLIDYVRVYQ